MLQTFKARLKAKTSASGVNLSQKRIDAYADRLHTKFPDLTEDADHDAKIDELDELVMFKDVAKEDDRVRALEAKAKQKPTPPKKEKTDPEDDDEEIEPVKPKKDDTPEWAKSLISEVQSLKAEKAQSAIKTKATEKLKDVPASYWGKRTLPEKEEDLDAFITEVQADYSTFKQDLINQGLAIQGPPPAAGGGGTGGAAKVSPELKAYVEKHKVEAKTTT